VYSDAQAKRGEDAYMGSCAQCHGDNLITVDAETPSLTGPRFKSEWTGKTLSERFELIKTTMPATNPGNLSDQANIDILAFILKFNGYPAGKEDLAADRAALAAIKVEAGP
jgi:mono/diheme cytochrome c family protein